MPSGQPAVGSECISRGCRYDHFSVLCELLPVGIPSLAACLQSLLHGMSQQWSICDPCPPLRAGGSQASGQQDRPPGTQAK